MGAFDGRVVIVTGGAQGQGAAEVRALVKAGATVVFGDVADGRALAAELGSRASFVHLDVSREEDWAAAVARAADLGPVRGLVNNAGILVPATMRLTRTEDFIRHMMVNQLGPFLGMRAVVPLMEQAGGGSIVNVSSSAGIRVSPRAFAYTGTKWALRGMTKSAAIDLAPLKIRVNSIHPGPIDTGMLDQYTREQRLARQAMVPMQREGTADEVANLVLFLLSDLSSFTTGAEITIDGGISL